MKMKNIFVCCVVLVLLNSPAFSAEDQNEPNSVAAEPNAAVSEQDDVAGNNFGHVLDTAQQQLKDSLAELSRLREQIAAETIPLSRKLSELENELSDVRLEYQKETSILDSRTLDLSNLNSEIKSRQQEAAYISNLLGEYIRNFESRLHIAEIQRYRQPLEAARLAPENSNLSEQEIFQAQAEILTVSLDRLFDSLGGARFEGSASDSSGSIHHGNFILLGPVAVFQSDDNKYVGTIEQRLGSLEPAIVEFGNPADANAASKIVSSLSGLLPLDPTLGNAHKIEQTKETIVEHIKKGGVVMYPIFALAGAALLVALSKWFYLSFMRKPSQKRIRELLDAVAKHDDKAVREKVRAIKGPVGKMLSIGVEHLNEPRELIEEVMYEDVLAARLRFNSFLPFVALSASSAPLLGLLGTVTGIINTFKLMTVYGSGDIKTLSAGISEALITTEYGLYVAIPSLLIYAFLSRKARGLVDSMEKAATAFINQVSKTPYRHDGSTNISVETVGQMRETRHNAGGDGGETLSINLAPARPYLRDSAGAVMNTKLLSVEKTATVAQAIDKIRTSEFGHDIDMVFIVDKNGKYTGHVPFRHLLIWPEHTSIESLPCAKSMSVRVDTHISEVHNIFDRHGIGSVPVLDFNDKLVGWIARSNGNGGQK